MPVLLASEVIKYVYDATQNSTLSNKEKTFKIAFSKNDSKCQRCSVLFVFETYYFALNGMNWNKALRQFLSVGRY